jgi:transcriptional regulator with XRE-family HTH domain
MANSLGIQIGARVRALRRKQKVTQEQLAELVAVTPESISNVERGVSVPSVRTLGLIAERLDVSLAALLDIDTRAPQATRRRLDAQEKLREIVASLGDDALEALVGHAELVARLQAKAMPAKRARG